jgi:hypothetical protein
MKDEHAETDKVVWARAGIWTKQCPKSLISPQSLIYLETHRTWKSLGKGLNLALDAKTSDAIEILEKAWAEEYERTKQD